MQILGFHHLTAVTANAKANHTFYTQTLGMRLVKKSVNQDDVSAYHLFYADGKGTPGTDLTFFEWDLPAETRGSQSIVRTGLRLDGNESLKWWHTRLTQLQVTHGEIIERDGRNVLDFEDGEGQRLSFIADGSKSVAPWNEALIPEQHQIAGLGAITISVSDLAPTDAVLTTVLGMHKLRDYKQGALTVVVYKMKLDGSQSELHVLIDPASQPSVLGAGGVHHLAIRTPNAEEYQEWVKRLKIARVPNSGPVDRYYFKSLYFREPNGVLFEIATDDPGFTADEPLETLGQQLALPPFLEGQRTEIEANLNPL